MENLCKWYWTTRKMLIPVFEVFLYEVMTKRERISYKNEWWKTPHKAFYRDLVNELPTSKKKKKKIASKSVQAYHSKQRISQPMAVCFGQLILVVGWGVCINGEKVDFSNPQLEMKKKRKKEMSLKILNMEFLPESLSPTTNCHRSLRIYFGKAVKKKR